MSRKDTHYINVNGKVEKFFRGVKKAGVRGVRPACVGWMSCCLFLVMSFHCENQNMVFVYFVCDTVFLVDAP